MNAFPSRFTIVFFLLLTLAVNLNLFAQFGGGYYVYNTVKLPDTIYTFGTTTVPVSFDLENIKAVGIGKTQVANGLFFNGMMYNPALLSEKRTRFDVLGVSANLPPETFTAADFVKQNVRNFTKGDFFKVIQQGIIDYIEAIKAQNSEQLIAAAKKINRGLVFPKELMTDLVGDPNNPLIHGIKIAPDIQIQVDNIGFTLHNNTQVGFTVIPTEFLVELSKLEIPEDGQLFNEQTLYSLLAILDEIITNIDNASIGLLPQAFAFSYADIVSTVGYGMDFGKYISLGANLKVINRRFSTKFITYDNYENILADARRDIKKSIWAFTMDIGALAKFEDIGMRIGLSLQNIIPPKKISSSIEFPLNLTGYDYYRDPNTGEKVVGFVDQSGNIQKNPNGDTMLVAYTQLYDVFFPFDLSAPFLGNLGIMKSITKDWDVSLDIYDMFAQDSKFVDYTERIRIGTEYRFLDNMFAVRLGFSDHHIAAGAGFNFNYFQLDVAYAFDNFVYNQALYAQIKFGF